MAFGITDAGFVLKRLADVVLETEQALKTALGANINLDARTPLGQIKGVLDERFSLIWELLEDIYGSQYPSTASGNSLDLNVALVGLTRKQPTKTTVANQILLGTATTLIPSGTVFSISGNISVRFVTDTDVTLIAGTDEVQTVGFSNTPDAGAFTLKYNDEETASIAFGDTASDVQTALRALPSLEAVLVTGTFGADFVVTFSGLDGKFDHPLLTVGINTLQLTPTATVITPLETTPGVAQGLVNMTAEATGATSVQVNTLTEIETPVSGLDSVKNYEDGTVGQALETDAELKLRRDQSLQTAGNATIEAIRATLLAVENVTSVTVFENETNSVDGDGRPPKSFECVVLDGDDIEIAQAIWESKPAGIETTSTASGPDEITEVITDTQGINHTIKFSRPTEIDIYLDLMLTVNASYPSDGDAQVEAAMVAFGLTLGVGDDVIVYPQLIAAINPIPGITGITVDIDTSPSPSGDANIAIAVTEIAIFDAANINVSS